MRVLHLPTPTGGNSWGLSLGERTLGLDSDVLVRESNWLDYPCHVNLHLEGKSNANKLARLFLSFLKNRNKYDIFHFNYGMSLIHLPKYGLYHSDLPFYPRKKGLFVTYNGCDARQQYDKNKVKRSVPCYSELCETGLYNVENLDFIRAKAINKMEKYTHHMWAVNPDLLYFLPKHKSSFLPYSIPILDKKLFVPDFTKRRITIVHAPTNRGTKGSSFILQALKEIQATHRNEVEVKLVENIPNREAIKIYRKADLIIDQLLIGWYGGFAVEVMNMGKPVICRIEKSDLHFLPEGMAEEVMDAFIQADPSNIKDVILRCIEDRDFLEKKSDASIEFARKWHCPDYVANITKEKYEEFM